MWIRSQDRTKLLKVEYIEYDTRREQITKELTDKKGKPIYYGGRPAEEIIKETIYHCIFINGLSCGTYSSKEKALKVVDMIDRHINGLNKRYVSSDRENIGAYKVLDNIYTPYGNVIFHMPQDDKV